MDVIPETKSETFLKKTYRCEYDISAEEKCLSKSETCSEEASLSESENCSEEKTITESEPVGKNWFNVFWTIKNFRFCFPFITSIEFNVDKMPYIIEISKRHTYLQFLLNCLNRKDPVIKLEISVLTWDGSPEESITGGLNDCLKVPKDVIYGARRNSFLLEDTLRIKVRISTFSESENLFIRSVIGKKRKSFVWTIKNFSNYAENIDDHEERMLKTLEDSEQYGEIVLFLRPESRVNSERYSIEISRSGKGAACYCILSVSLLDVDGKALRCVSEEFVFEENEQEHLVFPSVLKKNELFWCKNQLLPNDTLSLSCDFTISMAEMTKEIHYTSVEDESSSNDSFGHAVGFEEKGEKPDLSMDLGRTLQEGPFFDVALHIGSEVIQAHKVLLSARSPFLKSLLTKEESNGIIVVDDSDAETIRDFVLYLYTDAMPKYQWEKVKKLYLAARKYQVPSLLKSCVSLFRDNLSLPHVCKTLSFADFHKDENLKKAVLDFICDNGIVFFSSEEWNEFDVNSPLSIEVMRYVISNKRLKL